MLILPRVELATEGDHIDASGKPAPLTRKDLLDIVKSHDNKTHTPPIVLGHSGDDPARVPKNDSQPRFGFPDRLYIIDDENTGKSSLYGDLKVTSQLAKLIGEGNYFARSISFYPEDAAINPTKGYKHLRHIAMLGAVPPAIKGLEDIVEFAEPTTQVSALTDKTYFSSEDLVDPNSLTDSELAEKQKSCWKGYERVPGTKAGADGSCRKKGTKTIRKEPIMRNKYMEEKTMMENKYLMEKKLGEMRKEFGMKPSPQLGESIMAMEKRLMEMGAKLGDSPTSDEQQKDFKPTQSPVVERTKEFQESFDFQEETDVSITPEQQLMDSRASEFLTATLQEGEDGFSGEIVSYEPAPSIDNNYLMNLETDMIEGTFMDEDGEAYKFSINTGNNTKSFSPVNTQEPGDKNFGEGMGVEEEMEKGIIPMTDREMQIMRENQTQAESYREDPLITDMVSKGIIQSDVNANPSRTVRETEAESAIATADREMQRIDKNKEEKRMGEENRMLRERVAMMEKMLMEQKKDKMMSFANRIYSEGKISEGSVPKANFVSFMEALQTVEETSVSYSEDGNNVTKGILSFFQDMVDNLVPVVEFGENMKGGYNSDAYFDPRTVTNERMPGITFDSGSEELHARIIKLSETEGVDLNPGIADEYAELMRMVQKKGGKITR